MDGLVAGLLANVLHLGRPLRHYGVTFYLPLDLFSDAELQQGVSPRLRVAEARAPAHRIDPSHKPDFLKQEGNLEKKCEQEAYLYFLPYLREMIFDTQAAPSAINTIRHWRLKATEGRILDLDGTRAKFAGVSLFGYFNDLFVLALRLEPEAELPPGSSLDTDGPGWWRDLFFKPREQFERIKKLQLQTWLRFTNQARILYPSFHQQLDERKFTPMRLEPKAPHATVTFEHRDPFSPIVLEFLRNFFPRLPGLEKRLVSVPDDRMVANVAYGLAGLPPETEREQERVERLFSLALYVDHDWTAFDSMDGYAYDKTFIRERMQQDSLYRWRGVGTYSGFCAYANAYLGFGEFFNQVVAPEHVPYHYGRMLLLALLYQATLRHYNRRISAATDKLAQEHNLSGFRELRQEFIRFTNNYWFREVTTQVQGSEIFTRQTRALGLDTEYGLIKDEMERADEYSKTLREDHFNRGAAALAVAAVLTGLAGANFAFPEPESL